MSIPTSPDFSLSSEDIEMICKSILLASPFLNMDEQVLGFNLLETFGRLQKDDKFLSWLKGEWHKPTGGKETNDK